VVQQPTHRPSAYVAKGTEDAIKLIELRRKIAFIIGDIKIGENASTVAFKKYLFETLKFKAGLAVDLADCETIIRNLKLGYPRLSRWQEEIKKRASFRKYTETWPGRRRNIPEIASSNWNKNSFAERVAMNTPIQGTAADILKLALGRIIKGLPDRPWIRPLLQIHDELVFEMPENEAKNAVIFIKKCMETQPFDVFYVPIVAEASVGRCFGEMEELEGFSAPALPVNSR